MRKINPGTIVYIDETGFDEFYHRTHAYSRIGVPVIGKVAGRKFARTNLVAGLSNGKIIGEYFYKGNTKTDIFENWFKEYLLPNVAHGSTIILDNATFHSKKKLPKIAKPKKCKIMFLPPYSPDLNPIEKTWANIKKHLRQNMVNYPTLIDAVCSYLKTD